MTEFFSWSMMAGYTGALTMVLVVTQLTKEWKFINKLPTQLWSYLVSLAVLYSSYFFTGKLNFSNAVLLIFNGMVVALASNGGYEVLKRMVPGMFK